MGLTLSEIQDEDVAAAIAETQAAKAELMAEYNDLLTQSAEAENRGDSEAAAELDAQAAEVYQRVLLARSDEEDVIEQAEFELLGLKLWAVIVIIAGIIIFLIILTVLVIYCCRKRNHQDEKMIKVAPTDAQAASMTSKGTTDGLGYASEGKEKVGNADYYNSNVATDVNMESADNKPSATSGDKAMAGL